MEDSEPEAHPLRAENPDRRSSEGAQSVPPSPQDCVPEKMEFRLAGGEEMKLIDGAL